MPVRKTQILRIRKESQVQEIGKEMPRWTSKLANYKFDVIGITFSDVRYRKLKNFDYVFRTMSQEIGLERLQKVRIVKRFSQQSDFRRNLVIGSMRARRRKTLIWNYLQLKIHSPFFLRIMDKPTPLQSSLEISDEIDVESTFAPPTKTELQIPIKKLLLRKERNRSRSSRNSKQMGFFISSLGEGLLTNHTIIFKKIYSNTFINNIQKYYYLKFLNGKRIGINGVIKFI
ncbi:hypothetical protein O6H91_10G068600 [Diphasiastrum complanatum]|uniref:Uncharacterized protein n=1 Tax=Diphasiastrum complanatum TaxID=34168 RepID=A0ACC2CHZ1_DIPCM|nr:hypothetical protein O6H91_10G068600 [Diphasiastrum complanatum]